MKSKYTYKLISFAGMMINSGIGLALAAHNHFHFAALAMLVGNITIATSNYIDGVKTTEEICGKAMKTVIAKHLQGHDLHEQKH